MKYRSLAIFDSVVLQFLGGQFAQFLGGQSRQLLGVSFAIRGGSICAGTSKRDAYLEETGDTLKKKTEEWRQYMRVLKTSRLFRAAASMYASDHTDYRDDVKAPREISIVSDSSFASGGTVHLSWLSLTGGEQGKAIVRHEIGHQISSAIARSGFRASKEQAFMAGVSQCLNGFHPDHKLQHNPALFMPVSQYFEEDFADLIAATSDVPTVHPALCLLREKKSRWNTFLNPASQDPHSSVLLRVMHDRAATGELPNACQQLKDSFYPKVHLRNCLKRLE